MVNSVWFGFGLVLVSLLFNVRGELSKIYIIKFFVCQWSYSVIVNSKADNVFTNNPQGTNVHNTDR